MPVRSKTVHTGAATTRHSPRKRKQDASEEDELPLPAPTRQKLSASGTRNTTRGLPKSPVPSLKVEKGKKDAVADKVEQKAEENNENSDSSGLSSVPGDTAPDSRTVVKAKSEAKKQVVKRKSKEEKEVESMPLASRSTGLNMFVGAHVSIAKGVENAITNAVHIGGNAMAMFLQSQRKWENPELKPENRDAFIHACSHHQYDAMQHVVPHGSYLVNLAAKNPDQAKKSYDFFLNDLKRCESLGIKYYNFHPGATNQDPLPDAIGRLAKLLNKALSETSTVVPLLENMAGTESIIGSRFTDLAQIIALIKPEYQTRVGICIDTCHTFAAGYDLRTPEAFQKTFAELDDVVGLKYLRALHMNDSKGMFKSKKDLHQNIGLGFLGLRAFHNIMNEPRLANIPLILETPCDRPDPKDPKKTIDDKTVWSREIKLLESLIGMDPEGSEYQKLESDLAAQGKAERDKMEIWQAEKETKDVQKTEKARKKLEKAEKGQSSISAMFDKKKSRNKKSPSPSAGDGAESESESE